MSGDKNFFEALEELARILDALGISPEQFEEDMVAMNLRAP